MTRLPRWLEGPNGAERDRLHPSALSLDLQRRQTSSAQMTLPKGEPELAMHDWLQLYTAKGSAGLFRVSDIDGTIPSETAYTLMHAIDTLSDAVWKDQLDYTGTEPDFVAALLAQQTTVCWQLGTCAATGDYNKKGISYDTLSDLLSGMMQDLDDYYLDYDLSTWPWTLNILAAPSGVKSEFRLSRNIESLRVRRSDAEMCNRLFLSVNTKILKDPNVEKITLTAEDRVLDRSLTPNDQLGVHADLEVAPGAKYLISGYVYVLDTYPLVMFFHNTTLIGYSNGAGNQTGVKTDFTATVPSGADRMIINGRTSSDLGLKRVLNDGGDDEDKVTGTQTELRTYNDTASQAIYGVIEKTADIDTEDVADPDAWAAAFIARRRQPAFEISVDGQELTALTGDTWDEHNLAALCRVALPERGEALEARVESVNYPDIGFGQNAAVDRVTVELANRLPKFSDKIASMDKETKKNGKSGRSAGRGGASGAELDHWAMIVSKHNDVLDKLDAFELYETGIILDAEAGAKIYSLKQGFVSQYADIIVNSAAISTLVQKTGINSLGQNETLYSKILQNAEQIELKVAIADYNGNEIASRINMTSTTILIQAARIDLQGYVTASELSTVNAKIDNLMAGNTTASKILTNRLDTGVLNVLSDGSFSVASSASFSFKGTSVSWQATNVADPSGTGTITLRYLGRAPL